MSSTVANGTVPAAGRAGASVRLTRRGRAVAFVLFLALAVGMVVVGGQAIGSREAGEPVPVKVVRVQPGDTLWSIAAETAPGEDPRELIARIEQFNDLSGSLQVGQTLSVPLE